MEKTITLAFEGRTLRSRPFDMECYRVMYDGMAAGRSDAAAFAGLVNIMKGQGIEDIGLLSLPSEQLAAVVDTLTGWYFAVRAAPNAVSRRMLGGGGHPIRMLYQNLLKNHGLLPDEIDRQDPEFLYVILTEEHQEAVPADSIPDGLRVFYGL